MENPKITQLNNGIWVVHTASHSNVCHCGLIIDVGSRDENEDEQGLAHFIEHTIFKGTQKRRALQILSRIDEVGGELNAYTTKDETAVHATFLPNDLERATELIADMVFHSIFPTKEIEREKEVIADEILSYQDTPSEMIFDEFEENLFRGHALAHNILGSIDSLQTFNVERIQKFMQKNYQTDRMVFSVCGNVKHEKVLHLAQKYFDIIPANTGQRNRIPPTMILGERHEKKLGTHQCHIVLGGSAPDSYDTERLAMHLLSNYLGGDCMNAQLSVILREKNGIAYNVETSYSPMVDCGIFSIYFGTDSENLPRAMKIVERELRNILNNHFSSSKLERIKRQFIGQMRIASDSGESQMLSAAKSILLYHSIDNIEGVTQKVEAITAQNIIDVANKYLLPSSLSTLAYL